MNSPPTERTGDWTLNAAREALGPSATATEIGIAAFALRLQPYPDLLRQEVDRARAYFRKGWPT